ncbi:hypothetical protein LTR28_002065, partial [Elasticomyces elasticus]
MVLDGSMNGGRLPVSIYEPFYEHGTEQEDKDLQVAEFATGNNGRQLKLCFRQLPYEVETGEVEMIAVDFVAKGGGNATAVPAQTGERTISNKAKGKGKQVDEASDDMIDENKVLSAEDEERMIIVLNTLFWPLANCMCSHRLPHSALERNP